MATRGYCRVMATTVLVFIFSFECLRLGTAVPQQ